jgi:uncharacterized protein (DUF169 family)
MTIEIGKQILNNINNDNCYVISEGLERVLLISFMILAFLIMKFFLSEKENPQLTKEKESKSKMVEEYLEKYRKENEDFFFCGEDNSA